MFHEWVTLHASLMNLQEPCSDHCSASTTVVPSRTTPPLQPDVGTGRLEVHLQRCRGFHGAGLRWPLQQSLRLSRELFLGHRTAAPSPHHQKPGEADPQTPVRATTHCPFKPGSFLSGPDTDAQQGRLGHRLGTYLECTSNHYLDVLEPSHTRPNASLTNVLPPPPKKEKCSLSHDSLMLLIPAIP